MAIKNDAFGMVSAVIFGEASADELFDFKNDKGGE
ncbi:MAG: hypothetical protein ACI8Z5_001197 [Lentimonas sp.]|jgi:hypothetical protein